MTIVPHAPAYRVEGPLALSALAQAEAIRTGRMSSAELVEGYLARIAAENPRLLAFADIAAASARRNAARADRARARGHDLGPFHGVPIAVKDQHLVRGRPVTFGSRSMQWAWSPVDDPVVRRLRAAGFVILGKTTMSEFGLLPVTETAAHGATRTPWDLRRLAGGSSGGAGSALAAGLLPIALGSDGAGSVRIPAAINGLIGFKPSRGLIPDGRPSIDPFGLVTLGPLARTVDDAAALLDVLVGPASRILEASRAPLGRLRIGVLRSPPYGDVDPRLVAAVDAAAERLRTAGHEVVDRPTPGGTLEEFVPVYQHLFGRIPVVAPWRLEPTTRWFREQGKRVPLAEAEARVRDLAARSFAASEGFDAMLSPTLGMLVPEVGAFAGLDPQSHFRAAAPLGVFTAVANLTGGAAISVPFGELDGLPVGVQILARPGDDARVLALARQVLAG